jgi:1,6-anhydro-N-acetylmuramate kinase
MAYAVGLINGTSMDGIDAALVELDAGMRGWFPS